jgi:hypothetical protein
VTFLTKKSCFGVSFPTESGITFHKETATFQILFCSVGWGLRKEGDKMPMPNTFEVPVVGVTFQPTYPAALATLHNDDPVNVVRDTGNPTDPNAVRVEDADGIVLGYIPAPIARRLAPEMDAGVLFAVTIRPLINPQHTDRPGAMLRFTKVQKNK